MDKFIIVFFTMLTTLLLAKYLTNDNNEDVIIDFDNKKIKCKCNIDNKTKEMKENFTNYTKNLKIDDPSPEENTLETSINYKKQNEINITAQTYYQNNFKYPLEPLKINKYEVYPSNQYKYLDIGNDINKLIKNNI